MCTADLLAAFRMYIGCNEIGMSSPLTAFFQIKIWKELNLEAICIFLKVLHKYDCYRNNFSHVAVLFFLSKGSSGLKQ